jgi:opacity protein-like surface antigen
MKLNQIIRPMALSCLMSLPLIAVASASSAAGGDKLNFVDVKIGVDQPTTLNGNSALSGSTANTTYVGGIAVGRQVMDRLAVDLEYMHKAKNTTKLNDTNTGNNTTWKSRSDTVMLNLAVNLMQMKSAVMPYMKVGAGMSRNKSFDFVYTDSSDSTNSFTMKGKTSNKFAWQVGAGLNVETSPMFDTQVQYMFVNRGQIQTNTSINQTQGDGTATSTGGVAKTGKLQDHVITLGLRFKF